MFDITTRFEVNVLRGANVANDFNNLSNFMVKHRVPALVVDPSFIQPVLIERGRFRAQYKIIVAVDFDTGKRYAMEKMRPLPQEIFHADGLDILLSANRPDKESFNEMKILSDFIKISVNPAFEIRWVLGLRKRSYEEVSNIVLNIKKIAAPIFVRTDINLDSPGLTLEKHSADIEFIRKSVGAPIKLCGNIDLATITKLKSQVSRFDVSVTQAKKIAREAAERGSVPAVSEPPKEPQKKVAQDEPKEPVTNDTER